MRLALISASSRHRLGWLLLDGNGSSSQNLNVIELFILAYDSSYETENSLTLVAKVVCIQASRSSGDLQKVLRKSATRAKIQS